MDLLWFRKYLKQIPDLQKVYPNFEIPVGILHRKNWEWAFIISILSKAGMLKVGKCGLGFAVGQEPLPSYFASKGVRILATDLWGQNGAEKWTNDQNLQGNKQILNQYGICPSNEFNENVQIRNVDMNAIPEDIGKYDFCWSSCAVEHLGKKFLLKSLELLKPGGLSVHTVEFNVSSNTDTIIEGDTAIFRRCDIEDIAVLVHQHDGQMFCSFKQGKLFGDKFIDTPPYYHTNPRYHLHLDIGGYNCTSYGIVIKK